MTKASAVMPRRVHVIGFSDLPRCQEATPHAEQACIFLSCSEPMLCTFQLSASWPVPYLPGLGHLSHHLSDLLLCDALGYSPSQLQLRLAAQMNTLLTTARNSQQPPDPGRPRPAYRACGWQSCGIVPASAEGV